MMVYTKEFDASWTSETEKLMAGCPWKVVGGWKEIWTSRKNYVEGEVGGE